MFTYDKKLGWNMMNKALEDFYNAKDTVYESECTALKYCEADLTNYCTFYFDADEGNDNNDGLSQQSAKCSLNELSAIASKANSDNKVRILLKGGCVFKGNLNLEGYQAAEQFPLIIDMYIGDKGKALPVIMGDETVLKITESNTRIYNLEITGPQAYRGIFCVPSKQGALKNVVIEGCYVHDINFNWIYDCSPQDTNPDNIDLEVICPEFLPDKKTYYRYFYRYYGGIIFLNETSEEIGPSWFENIWVLNNRVERVARTGITIYSKWSNKGGVGYGYNKPVDDTQRYNNQDIGLGYYVHKNTVFNGNKLEVIGGDGLVVSSVEDCFVEGNTCYWANYLGRKNYWNAAIWVFNATNCIFQFNEAAYTYMRHGSQDAQGFDIDNACENVKFQYNYAHHNEGGGLLICNNITSVPLYNQDGSPKKIDEFKNVIKEKLIGKWVNNHIRNNIFAYNGTPQDPTRSAFITIAREVDLVFFTNNIIIFREDIKGQSVINTEDETQYCYKHFYGNNIFYCKQKSDSKLTVKMMKDFVFYNNLYFNMGEHFLLNAKDKNLIQDIDPEFICIDAISGYSNSFKIKPSNKKVYNMGKIFADMARKDYAQNDAIKKKYLGCFSELES